MATTTPPYTHLHAVIGDALAHLPPHLAERLEKALAAREEKGLPPLLQAQIGLAGCADGSAWSEDQLSPERCEDLAMVSRQLRGLSAVMQVVHAIFELRRRSSTPLAFNDSLIPGLLVASRELVESAMDALHRCR